MAASVPSLQRAKGYVVVLRASRVSDRPSTRAEARNKHNSSNGPVVMAIGGYTIGAKAKNWIGDK